MNLIIKNGTIINANAVFKADIGIEDGIIKLIGDLGEISADKTVDAEGKYVFPGIIDIHNHINHVGGSEKTRDDFFQGTRSAAFGGVTTLMDFAMQKKGETILDAIERRRSQADNKVCIDYSLHANITDLSGASNDNLKSVIESGYTSFKLFMTYEKAGFKVADPVLYNVMQDVTGYGGMIGIHAENDDICEYLTAKLLEEGKISTEYHPVSRPNIAEAECISKAILFAEYTDSSLYIFHLTTREGVRLVREAKRKGLKVYAETCPHYLTLSEEKYKSDDAYRYIMTPPLRQKEDIEALWEAVGDNTISIVSSDHCCYATTQKQIEEGQSFKDITPGIPGNETLLPIVYQYGVKGGRIDLKKMVELLSYNPSRLFGLYPRKGEIMIGSDADLVIFDPEKEFILEDAGVHMETDYTPYNNTAVQGYPEKTIYNGKIIVDNGVFYGEEGAGQFISRNKPEFF